MLHELRLQPMEVLINLEDCSGLWRRRSMEEDEPLGFLHTTDEREVGVEESDMALT